MNRARLNSIIALALMGASFVGAAAWRPTRHMTDGRPKVDLESIFPKSLGDWRVDDRLPVQLVSPDLQAILASIYNQTLSRTYINSRGERIMLSVAYGGDQSDATRAHRPEVCYPAQGFQIVESRATNIPVAGGLLPVRNLVARQGARNEPITYWLVVGDRLAVTGTEQKLAQLSYTMTGVIPDGMLVRISSIDREPARAYGLHTEFARALFSSMAPSSRRSVFGSEII